MQNNFWEKAKPIYEDLAEPFHNKYIRDHNYKPNKKNAVDLSSGYVLDVSEEAFYDDLETALEDFRQFLSGAMGVREVSDGYKILISKGKPGSCPAEAAEAFEIVVNPTHCEIIAPDSNSARRGLIFLEDQMTSRRTPVLPLGTKVQWTKIKDRITRSPIASYRWKTGWELLDEYDYYPEEYLNKLAHYGVNGIWVAGLFRNLIRTQILPELGPESNQLGKLKKLVEKAGRYGIKVYMFCIEPRAVDIDHPVFKSHPEIRGAGDICLCTSTPVVQEYIRQATCELFSEVPGLGGIINIFNGERITNCWLSEKYAQTCPRCSLRKQIDVLAEDLNCFAEGIRMSGSKGKCIAWAYLMDPDNSLETRAISPLFELMEKVDKNIVWMGNFEHEGKKLLCEKEIPINEYSLSYTGPSESFKCFAEQSGKDTYKIYSKIQLGTTYELSSVPYLPIPGKIYDKFQEMKKCGVTGSMLSWIPGGFPSLMLKAVDIAAFCESESKENFLHNLARIYWPSQVAEEVVNAWKFFEDGIDEYPFTNRLCYFGPITRAPAYPLNLQFNPNHANPYNWGFDRNRNPQPFEEDFERWCSPFTPNEMIGQLQKMVDKFSQGLKCLQKAVQAAPSVDAEKQYAVSSAVLGHFRSALNIFNFLCGRKELGTASDDEKNRIIEKMKSAVEGQITQAKAFKTYITIEPLLGFHSEMLDFSYDLRLLDQAIEKNEETLAILRGKAEIVIKNSNMQSQIIPEKTGVVNVDLYGD